MGVVDSNLKHIDAFLHCKNEDPTKQVEIIKNIRNEIQKSNTKDKIYQFRSSQRAVDILARLLLPNKDSKYIPVKVEALKLLQILFQSDTFIQQFFKRKNTNDLISLYNDNSIALIAAEINLQLSSNKACTKELIEQGMIGEIIVKGMDSIYPIKEGNMDSLLILRECVHILSNILDLNDEHIINSLSHSNILNLLQTILRESKDEETIFYSLKLCADLLHLNNIKEQFLTESGIGIDYVVQNLKPDCSSRVKCQAAKCLTKIGLNARKKDFKKLIDTDALDDLTKITKTKGDFMASFEATLALFQLSINLTSQYLLCKNNGMDQILKLRVIIEEESPSYGLLKRMSKFLKEFSENIHTIIVNDIIYDICGIIVYILNSIARKKVAKDQDQIIQFLSPADRPEQLKISLILCDCFRALSNICMRIAAQKYFTKRVEDLLCVVDSIYQALQKQKKIEKKRDIDKVVRTEDGNSVKKKTQNENIFEVMVWGIRTLCGIVCCDHIRGILYDNNEFGSFVRDIFLEYQEYLHKIIHIETSYTHLFQEMLTEVKLGLIIYFHPSVDNTNTREMKRLLLKGLNNPSFNVRCKALKGCSIVIKKREQIPENEKQNMEEKELRRELNRIKYDENGKNTFIKRSLAIFNENSKFDSSTRNSIYIQEMCKGLREMTRNMKGLSLWLKMEANPTIDSANQCILKQWGEPQRFPLDKGMFNNWGCFFSFGDMVEIINTYQNITLPEDYTFGNSQFESKFQRLKGNTSLRFMNRPLKLKSYTISVWILLPLPEIPLQIDISKKIKKLQQEENDKWNEKIKKLQDKLKKLMHFHTLIQNYKGYGAYLCIDSKGKWLGSFDEVESQFVRGVNIRNLKRGWHHFALIYQPYHLVNKANAKYFVNGKLAREQILNCHKKIKFIGNSATGKEPFGCFCDLRIFDHVLSQKQLDLNSTYLPYKRQLRPDYLLETISQTNIIENLIDSLNCEVPETLVEIFACLANLSSEYYCRTKLLKIDVIKRALDYMNHPNKYLRIEIFRLLNNL